MDNEKFVKTWNFAVEWEGWAIIEMDSTRRTGLVVEMIIQILYFVKFEMLWDVFVERPCKP